MATNNKNWFQVLASLVSRGALPHYAHRILLSGPPGTGKSYAASSLFLAHEIVKISCHGERLPETFCFGQLSLKGGSTTEVLSPVARAMRNGACLVLDEIDRLPISCHSALLSALDDKETCRLFSEISGETITPAVGFVVVATTNETPEALDEALRDRFDLLIRAETPSAGLIDTLPPRSRDFLRNLLPSSSHGGIVFPQKVTPRSVMRFERLAAVVGDQDAAELIFGGNAASFLTALAVGGAR